MTTGNWELLQRQGSREVWVKRCKESDGTETSYYKGEEYSELRGERQKVEELEYFETETQALAWLNAGVS